MRRLWAVARETFIECLRTRIAGIFLVLLAVCVLGMALTLEGDGTLKGRVQTFLAYSLGATQLLLGIVTVFLATGVVAGDIRRKHIFHLAAKPLARWQYVVGRWLGIVLLNGLLLGLSLASIYALAEYLRGLPTETERRRAAGRATEGETDVDRLAVENEIFTARKEHRPDPPDIREQVRQRVEQLEEQIGRESLLRSFIRQKLSRDLMQRGQPGEVSDQEVERAARDLTIREQALEAIREDVRKKVLEEHNLVYPGVGLILRFTRLQVPPGSRDTLQLRYRLHPIRNPLNGLMTTSWLVLNPQTGQPFILSRTDSSESSSSLMIPPEAVSTDGRMEARYINNTNLQPDPTAIKMDLGEVALLYRTGTFHGNVLRCGALMLLRLMFLTGMGVLFGVFLSFPVACLCCLLVLSIGLASGFITDSTRLKQYDPNTWFDYFSHYVATGMYKLLPAFGKTSPGDALVEGRNVPFSLLGAELVTGTGVRVLAGLLLACLIFRRRELARVQA